MAAGIVFPAVGYLHPFLRQDGVFAGIEGGGFGPVGRIGRLVAVEIGQDQLDITAIAHGAIGGHAGDGDAIIGLGAKAVVVKAVDRRVDDCRRVELIEPAARRLLHARRHIFPPRLVGGDAQALGGLDGVAVLDEALPALPREFVVVADADKRKVGAGVLDVGVVDVRLIDVAVAGKRGRHVEIADLARVGNAAEIIDGAGIAVRHLIGIFDDLIDKVAEMQDEAEFTVGGRLFVLPDHAAIGVLRAFIDAVAGHEGEADGARIRSGWGGDGAADAAACAGIVREAVPVLGGRSQPADQGAARPVGRRQYGHARGGDDVAEIRIARHFDGQLVAVALLKRPPGPQDDAVIVGIARSDALRIEGAILAPCDARCRGAPGPDCVDAEGCRARQELPPIHITVPADYPGTLRPTDSESS